MCNHSCLHLHQRNKWRRKIQDNQLPIGLLPISVHQRCINHSPADVILSSSSSTFSPLSPSITLFHSGSKLTFTTNPFHHSLLHRLPHRNILTVVQLSNSTVSIFHSSSLFLFWIVLQNKLLPYRHSSTVNLA